jgi:hypothetical protein
VREASTPVFTKREIAALPVDMARALEMVQGGMPLRQVRAETGIYIWRLEDFPSYVREYLDESDLEALEADRHAEAARAALVPVLGTTMVNLLARHGVLLSARSLQETPDEAFLKLRNFGVGSLRKLREHFPYQSGAANGRAQ